VVGRGGVTPVVIGFGEVDYRVQVDTRKTKKTLASFISSRTCESKRPEVMQRRRGSGCGRARRLDALKNPANELGICARTGEDEWNQKRRQLP
jgi:hypothetical protein